jgi:hypothetical protein
LCWQTVEQQSIPALAIASAVSTNIMKTLRDIFSILTLAIFCSCSNTSTNNPETIKNDSIIIDTTNISSKSSTNIETENAEETVLDIKFQELSLSINRLLINDEDKKLEQIQKDTVTLYLELGEPIEEQKISISSNQLTNLTVEQRYETSITIMNEGPHCDLTDWKHFYSDWKQLKVNSEGQFICDKYSESDGVKFPKISIEELKKKVKEQCGNDWVKLIEKIKSPTDYPSGVSISRYFIRLTGKRKDNGSKVTKLIIIETPMGD